MGSTGNSATRRPTGFVRSPLSSRAPSAYSNCAAARPIVSTHAHTHPCAHQQCTHLQRTCERRRGRRRHKVKVGDVADAQRLQKQDNRRNVGAATPAPLDHTARTAHTPSRSAHAPLHLGHLAVTHRSERRLRVQPKHAACAAASADALLAAHAVVPFRTRPARPARCVADALLIGATSSVSLPDPESYQRCFEKPLSTTYTTPGIVTLVSAMFVLTTTLRCPAGASLNACNAPLRAVSHSAAAACGATTDAPASDCASAGRHTAAQSTAWPGPTYVARVRLSERGAGACTRSAQDVRAQLAAHRLDLLLPSKKHKDVARLLAPVNRQHRLHDGRAVVRHRLRQVQNVCTSACASGSKRARTHIRLRDEPTGWARPSTVIAATSCTAGAVASLPPPPPAGAEPAAAVPTPALSKNVRSSSAFTVALLTIRRRSGRRRCTLQARRTRA